MNANRLEPKRVRRVLQAATRTRVLVVGDVMLDHFVWGNVGRISPEAPVPVVEFERENFMPGGAANVARNLAAFGVRTSVFGTVGCDPAAAQLRHLLKSHRIGCRGLLSTADRLTSIKTRIVAHKQQVVRVDRETRTGLDRTATARLLSALEIALPEADALIVADYGKGVVTDALLGNLKRLCRRHGVWLSLDPKPVHPLDLTGLSLITPNRKETFELAGLADETRNANPLADANLMRAAEKLLAAFQPAVLLVTLGDLGMLLCQRGQETIHIPTLAQEVYDVSGAGDTVIATFTLAISTGASPVEAAVLANHAAGIVVGKIGTATVTTEELLATFNA